MARERFEELARGGIELLVPQEVIQRIEASFGDFRELATWQEDLPHGLPHVIEALSVIHHFSITYTHLSPVDGWLAGQAVRYHDKGYIFVRRGVLKPEEHHFGSVYYAWKGGCDDRVLAAVAIHTEDVLPPKTPAWVKLVRDADRVSRLGYTGINNLVYYEGFWSSEPINEEIEEYANNRILCEEEYPDFDDYESEAKKHFELVVVPFLRTKGHETVNKLRLAIQEMERRASGDTRQDLEPIMREVRSEYYRKFDHTRAIIDRLFWLNTAIYHPEDRGWGM